MSNLFFVSSRKKVHSLFQPLAFLLVFFKDIELCFFVIIIRKSFCSLTDKGLAFLKMNQKTDGWKCKDTIEGRAPLK